MLFYILSEGFFRFCIPFCVLLKGFSNSMFSFVFLLKGFSDSMFSLFECFFDSTVLSHVCELTGHLEKMSLFHEEFFKIHMNSFVVICTKKVCTRSTPKPNFQWVAIRLFENCERCCTNSY